MKVSNIADYAGLKLTDQDISTLTLRKLEEIKNSSSKLKNFFGILKKVDNNRFAVFGGAVRDWYLGRKPKDIDIVLDCPAYIIDMLAANFEHKKSHFNGYQFEIDGINLDVWRLEDSWYFRQGQDKFVILPSWSNLVGSTPFYMDAILVFKNHRVLETGFYRAMFEKTIELQNSVNKNPKIFIVQRALRFKEKYNFKLGPVLQTEINKLKHSEKDLMAKIASSPQIKRISSN